MAKSQRNNVSLTCITFAVTTYLRPTPTAKSQRNNVSSTCNHLLSDNTLYAPSPYSNGEILNPPSPKSHLPLAGHLHLLDPLIHHSPHPSLQAPWPHLLPLFWLHAHRCCFFF
ncbi:hypothetical protein AHAS_Ahas11G0147300 [Arachis hypogaea]